MMKPISRWFGFLAALLLLSLVGPSYAQQSQNKTFSVDMSVLFQGAGSGSSQVQAVVKNTSPSSSNSTFSSVDLFVDLAWVVDSKLPITASESNDPSTLYPVDISQAGHIKVSNLAPIKPFQRKGGTSLVITFWVTSASCGDSTWNANVWSGSQIGSGNIFTQNGGQNMAPVACQNLACGGNEPIIVDPTQVTVVRDAFNKDGTSSGTSCNAVDSYASNTNNNFVGLPPDIVHFRWDQSDTTFATAAFEYYVFYNTAPTTTSVGWLYLNGKSAINPGVDPNADSSNPVVFIDAPNCLSPNLPTPYGSLNSPLSANSTTVKIDTSTGTLTPPQSIPSDGFPIYIGTERMQVIAYTQNGWTVQPRTNGVSHPKNALVMSTPLPILQAPINSYLADGTTAVPAATSPYQPGMQAQVCKVTSGTMPDMSTPPNQVPFVEIIDIGDSWTLGR